MDLEAQMESKTFYSYSKLSSYDSCPLQYDLQYRRLVKLPKVFSFEVFKGLVFHKYAEVYAGDRRAALDIALTPSGDLFTPEFLNQTTTEQKQQAMEYTRLYDQLWETRLSGLASEHEIKLFEHEPYRNDSARTFAFTGYIDNLINADNSYTIIDYKTAKSANASRYKTQLILYAYFLSKSRNIPLSKIKAALFFPCAEDVSSFEERWKPISITEKAVEKELTWMHDVIEKIEKEPFCTDANLHFLCKWCSFAGDEQLCPTSVIAGLRKSS